MTHPPHKHDPVTVVIPVHNAAGVLAHAVAAWQDALNKLDREHDIVLVDDGSTDGTAAKADEVAGKRKHVRVLKHDVRRGFGACLRTALAEPTAPLVFYTALDYPYTPADLSKLLDRIEHTDEVLHRKLDVVSGSRAGRPTPAVWTAVGYMYRLFCRVAFGLSLEKPPGWLGVRERARSWLVWPVFGDPLNDPNSAFKLFRRSILDRFPIQCDGDFVHVELVSKCTFLTALMDELALTPRPDPVPAVAWGGVWKLFTDARFHRPPAAAPEPTPVNPPDAGPPDQRTAADPSLPAAAQP
jgi:glycosyltransferase involved in cell wall biosynthesis